MAEAKYGVEEMPADGPPSPFSYYVRRLTDGALIPPDPANRDFQEFLEWNESQDVPLELPE